MFRWDRTDLKPKLISYFIMIAWIIISIYNDMHFFDFSYSERVHVYISNGNQYAWLYYILCKLATIILVNYFRRYILNVFNAFKNKSAEVTHKFMYISMLLIVYIVIAWLMYPGIWWANDADEFTTLSFVKNLQIQYNQGTLQSVFYTIALMVFPRPFVIIILQIVIGIGALGNVIYDNYCHTNNKLCFILHSLFLFTPACIYFALYPMRAWLFAVSFAVLCYKVYEILKYKNSLTCQRDNIMILVSLILIVNYRSESKVLMIIFPCVICVYGLVNKMDYRKELLKIMAVMTVSIVIFSLWNTVGNQATKKTHSILFLIQPLGGLINDNIIDIMDKDDELEAISKIINLEVVNTQDTQGEIDENLFTEEEWREGVSCLVKINLRHPFNYLKIKWNNMLDSIGLTGFRNIKYEFPRNVLPDNIRPILYCKRIEMHNMVARVLAGDISVCGIPLYYIWYAFWIPALCSLMMWIYGVVRNKWQFIVPCTLLLAEMVVVMLFSPVHYTMYYLYIYLAGWILIIDVATGLCPHRVINEIN